ncbi:MAG: MBL fold metallo-hydrolase [Clostridia bacterium]|nr:MBL fold metallo-hydrolase [Clostridia bacterium]
MEKKKTSVPYFASEKIAEGSYLIRYAFIPKEAPLYCYLIEGRDYALLIDTMMGWGNLKAYCETLTDRKILLANTHVHPDHTGGNFHFDACYLHHRDIPYFQLSVGYGREVPFEQARQSALPEYRDLIVLDDSFADAKPMRVFPLYDGDVFDLGDRQIEVVEVGGHTPGSIVFIDHASRIAYTGDACNGNTLLEFSNSLPISAYLQSVLRLKAHQSEFDRMYGGHEIFDASLVDEAIEAVARVLAGTDDKCERMGMMGKPVFYAAQKVENGYPRVDGKHFNMSYRPEKVWAKEPAHQTITLDPPAML